MHISSHSSEAEMRRIPVLFLFIMSTLPISSAALGYSLAPVGVMSPSAEYGGLTASFIFSPYEDVHAGDISISVDLAPVEPFFEGVSVAVSSPLFLTSDHPFSWAFSNPVLWAPRLSAGAWYRLGGSWEVMAGLAPFAFQDTHFIYEFLSPFALYSITAERWGWGMYVMRFSYFF